LRRSMVRCFQFQSVRRFLFRHEGGSAWTQLQLGSAWRWGCLRGWSGCPLRATCARSGLPCALRLVSGVRKEEPRMALRRSMVRRFPLRHEGGSAWTQLQLGSVWRWGCPRERSGCPLRATCARSDLPCALRLVSGVRKEEPRMALRRSMVRRFPLRHEGGSAWTQLHLGLEARPNHWSEVGWPTGQQAGRSILRCPTACRWGDATRIQSGGGIRGACCFLGEATRFLSEAMRLHSEAKPLQCR